MATRDIDSPDYRDSNIGEGFVPSKQEREQERKDIEIRSLRAEVERLERVRRAVKGEK